MLIAIFLTMDFKLTFNKRYQSNQLNEINTRVSSLLHNFEEQNQKDDAFNLIEESEETKFFDKKSLLEESKGKVQNDY